jgi:CRP-like cAMP-binding protein
MKSDDSPPGLPVSDVLETILEAHADPFAADDPRYPTPRDALTPELAAEAEAWPAAVEASAHRAGYDSIAAYLNAAAQLGFDPATGPPRHKGRAVDRCIATFRAWLYMPDPGALLVTLATVAANRAEGDPVWLLVVGPPGSGKTEIINAINGQPDIHVASTLTEGSLLSGTPKRERGAKAKGGLLREIGDFGIIVLKDFGSVLSMNRDTRGQVLAALREIFDGEWTRHVGTDGGQTLSWSGKVALIAGVTPAIDAHHAVIGSMGERFIFYRLPLTDADVQAQRALGHVGRERQMRKALAEAVRDVLDGADPDRLLAAPDAVLTRRLVEISTLAVRCRSAVDRDGYTHEITLIPEAEAPARLALVLLRLHNALRAIGVDGGQAWELVTACALDSMPAIRRAVLGCVVADPEPLSTTAIAERLGYPTITVRRTAEDLAAHGIIVRAVQGPGLADLWRAPDWTRERWPEPPTGMSVEERSAEATGTPLTHPLPIHDDFSVVGTPALTLSLEEWAS